MPFHVLLYNIVSCDAVAVGAKTNYKDHETTIIVEARSLDMSVEVTISKGLCQSSRDFWVCV